MKIAKRLLVLLLLLTGIGTSSNVNGCGDPGQQPLLFLSGKWVDGMIMNASVTTTFDFLIRDEYGNYFKTYITQTKAKVGGDGVMVVDIPSGFAIPEGYYTVEAAWSALIRKKGNPLTFANGYAAWNGCIDSNTGWFFTQLPMMKF